MDMKDAMRAGVIAALVLSLVAGVQGITYINENVVVAGTVSCTDSVWFMNSSFPNQYYIKVEATGDLTLQNCTITSDYGYKIDVYGDISVDDSIIQKLGTSGLTLYSGANVLSFGNVTFEDSIGTESSVNTAEDILLTGDVRTDIGFLKITANGVTADGGLFDVVSSSGAEKHGIYSYDSTSRTGVTIKNFGLTGFYNGIYLYRTSDSTVVDNTIYDSVSDGIRVHQGSGNAIIENNITASGGSGLNLVGDTNNNVILNNDIYSNTANQILSSLSSYSNHLIYNNSEGEIFWTNPSFIAQLTVGSADQLIFGQTINITHNLASVSDDFVTAGLHSTANVSLYNTPGAGMSQRAIAYNKYQLCSDITSPSCTPYTSLDAATVIFGVEEWSNYSISDLNLSALKIDQTIHMASQGGILIFNINLTNVGNVTLQDVVLMDNLPEGLTYLGANGTHNVSLDNRTITWEDIGNMSKGDTFFVVLNATVDSPLSGCINLTNNITASALYNKRDHAQGQHDRIHRLTGRNSRVRHQRDKQRQRYS